METKQKIVNGQGLQEAMGILANYSDTMDRGLAGGFNQAFPLTSATKGNIYYHKNTNRFYVCVENHSGSSLSNPNSKFEELSIYKNRQRLDNLITHKTYTENDLRIKSGVMEVTIIDQTFIARFTSWSQPSSRQETIHFPFSVSDKSVIVTTDNDGGGRSALINCNWIKNNQVQVSGFEGSYTAIIIGTITN